jgi:hypothetical protein
MLMGLVGLLFIKEVSLSVRDSFRSASCVYVEATLGISTSAAESEENSEALRVGALLNSTPNFSWLIEAEQTLGIGRESRAFWAEV